MDSVELEVKKTRINIVSVLAWFAFGMGVIAAVVQLFEFSGVGFFCAAAGLIGGGIAATFAGPVRTVSYRKVRGYKIETKE